MKIDPHTADQSTRHSLLLRLRDTKDELAWMEFTAIYEPVIYRMIRRRGMQDADAREIVQEVLLSVSSAIDRYDLDGVGSFRGWLSRITRNATVDRIRKLKARKETLDGSGVARAMDAVKEQLSTELSDEFDLGHRRQLFRWAASQVRQKTGEVNWMAFWRTSVDGVSTMKVARELGISEGAVYVARCRVLKCIRQQVHQRLDD